MSTGHWGGNSPSSNYSTPLATPPAPPAPPPYVPAAHLVVGSLLTAPELVSQFEDFRNNLRYVSTAPEFVFERLAANLSAAFTATLELERRQHAITLQVCHDENKTLQLSNEKLQERLSELNEAIPTAGGQESSETPETAHRNPITIGSFSTDELRERWDARAETWRVVPFSNPYPAPPGLPVGLTMLDIECSKSPRVKAYTSGIQNDRFNIHIHSWGDTVLYGATCMWLELGVNDLDFQFGSYNTLEDPLSDPPRPHNERKIAFERSFSTPPFVVAWLTGFDMGVGSDFRVKTYATNVTTTGFTIHIGTWGDSVLNSGISSWVAYPTNKPGIFSGHFSTLDLSPVRSSQPRNSGYEVFGRNIFAAAPRTFLAIDSFDMDKSQDLRLALYTSSKSAVGMQWHLDTWNEKDSLYSAGASYIALR